MCLVKCHKLNINEDIICYKYVTVKLDGYLYQSPVRKNTFWQIGKQKEIKNLTGEISEYKAKLLHNSYIDKINGCAYHTFENLEDAMTYASFGSPRHYAILKCIIPKSSKYVFKGENFEGKQSYASQKLKPIEIVKVTAEEVFV